MSIKAAVGLPLSPRNAASNVDPRAAQIHDIAEQTKAMPQRRLANFRSIEAIPGGTVPVNQMKLAAALLVEHKDTLSRFVDKFLRKV